MINNPQSPAPTLLSLNNIILWCIPLGAIAYFDETLAVLFSIPILVIASISIHISNWIKKHLPSKAVSKKIEYFGPLLISSIILIFGLQHYSPTKLFENAVVSPIPKSVKIIKTGGQLSVFGISSFYVLFAINNSDFPNILAKENFELKDIQNISGRKPHLYKRALNEAEKFIEDTSEIYVQDDKISSYRCKVIVTNTLHEKVYYRIF